MLQTNGAVGLVAAARLASFSPGQLQDTVCVLDATSDDLELDGLRDPVALTRAVRLHTSG